MIIQNIIVPTTHLKPAELFIDIHGQPSPLLHKLNVTIEQILALRKTPVLVIGSAGDEILRGCLHIEDCELVFDPNYQGNLFSSVKAGLHTCFSGAFLLPQLSDDFAKPELWGQLEQVAFAHHEKDIDILCPVAHDEKKFLPLIITPHGARHLMSLAAETDWEESASITRQKISLSLVA